MRVPRLAGFACAAGLVCAGCGSAPSAAERAAGDRALVLSDVHITGEFLTPTPAVAGTGFGGEQPTPGPAGRATLGPISFQTPTPIPTGVAQVTGEVAAEVQPNGASTPAAGAVVQTSGSIPRQLPRTPTQPPAPTATPVMLTKGQSMLVNLPAGTASCDTSQAFKFRYPGDGSIVTIDAQLDGLNPGNAGDAGLHVWDSTSTSAPVINVTTLSNQKNNLLGSMELLYQRSIAGSVTVELYNWTQTPLTGSVTVVSLASNFSPLQVVEQKSPGAC